MTRSVLAWACLAASLVSVVSFAQAGCLLTSDFDGLSSGGASATSATTDATTDATTTATDATTTSGTSGDCCLGQICGSDGQCEPIELVNDATITSVAIDADTIYWTDSTYAAVRSLPKDAAFGATPTIVTSTGLKPATLVARGTALFLSAYDKGADVFTVLRKDLNTEASAITLASGAGKVTSLSVDATHVYFSVLSQSFASSILRCLHSGTPMETLVAETPYTLLGLTLDTSNEGDGYVYWARFVNAPDGAVQRIHKEKLGAEQPTSLLDVQARPRSVVVDGDTLYWTNSDITGTHGYSLLKAPLAGGEVTVIDASLETPWALAKLGQQLAWTALGGQSLMGSVAVTDLGSGDTRVLATGQAWPGSVAIDAEAVYWANEYDDRLQKVGTCACTP